MSEQAPRIGVIMGSDSDLSVMRQTSAALNQLGLEHAKDFEYGIKSAHRTPEAMIEYARTAADRGLQVIVAGAGGSAHLPGMVASETQLPVLGVAITSNPDVMNRALGSMIGMPKGKPLATFQAEAGAYNAGLFAARIVALGDTTLRAALENYDSQMQRSVWINDRIMGELGPDLYTPDPRTTG